MHILKSLKLSVFGLQTDLEFKELERFSRDEYEKLIIRTF